MVLDTYLRAADPLGVAVRDAERALAYGELADEAARVAGGLAALGIARGDRAAFLLKNRADVLVLVLALARLGAVAVPLSWRLGAGEIAGILADSGARLLLTEPALQAAVASDAAGVPAHRVLAGGPASAGWRSLAELRDAAPVAPVGEGADGDEGAPLLQIYTSGTTGTPKGAVLTAGNVRAFVATWVRETDLASPDDRVYLGSPLFHVGGLVMAICTLAAGAELRLHPEFEPRLALDTLEREHVTHALFVPAMLRWMLGERDVEQRAFPALRRIVYGAAPIPPELLTRALRVFDCGFVQGYGLTETTGALTVLRPEDHAPGVPPERLASAGRPLDCCEVRVVDEHGGDVRSGRAGTDGPVGEVVARGANVFAGYWNLPDANAEAFRDGWFHTGDLARIDADGYLTLVDRKKDMLVVGGENVYPREVEDALLAHPDVADAAVIGAPHDVWGEEVLALVVVPPGCAPPRAFDRILIHHCRERLAVFKCPTRVELRDALPRNAAGKLDKKALREPYWAGRSRRI